MDFVKFTKKSSIITCFFNLFCQQLICQFEKSWLQSCPYDFNIYYYRVYINVIFFFYLLHQNNQKPYKIVDMLPCHLQLKLKSKTECPFLMYKFFANIKTLLLLSTVNLPLVEFIHILTPFYHLPSSLVLFTHSPHRCLRICSSWTKLHNELVYLKEIL